MRTQAQRHLRTGGGAAAPELLPRPPVRGGLHGVRVREDPPVCEEAAGRQAPGAQQEEPVDPREAYLRLFQAQNEAIPQPLCSIFTSITG